jgi:hypothetical protein
VTTKGTIESIAKTCSIIWQTVAEDEHRHLTTNGEQENGVGNEDLEGCKDILSNVLAILIIDGCDYK